MTALISMAKIIYNVTVSIEPDVEQAWITWMRNVHIPEVVEAGGFTEARFSRVLNGEGDNSYSIQYLAESMDVYENYRNTAAARMQQKAKDLFENKFVAFRTLLELID